MTLGASLLLNASPDVEALRWLVHSSTAGVVQQLHPFSRNEASAPLLMEVALQARHQPDTTLTQHLQPTGIEF